MEVRTELYHRGLFVLETLREVRALLLVLDFATEDCLCDTLEVLFGGLITEGNVSDVREVVMGLAGDLLVEGGRDLGDRPWEVFLLECGRLGAMAALGAAFFLVGWRMFKARHGVSGRLT